MYVFNLGTTLVTQIHVVRLKSSQKVIRYEGSSRDGLPFKVDYFKTLAKPDIHFVICNFIKPTKLVIVRVHLWIGRVYMWMFVYPNHAFRFITITWWLLLITTYADLWLWLFCLIVLLLIWQFDIVNKASNENICFHKRNI